MLAVSHLFSTSFLHQPNTTLPCDRVKSKWMDAHCCTNQEENVTFSLSDDTSLGGLRLHDTYDNGWKEYRYQTMGEDVFDIFTPVPITHAIFVHDEASHHDANVDVIMRYHTFMHEAGMSGPTWVRCGYKGTAFPWDPPVGPCDMSSPGPGDKDSVDRRWGIIHHGRKDRIYAFPTYPAVYPTTTSFQGYGTEVKRFDLNRRWDARRSGGQASTVTDRVVVDNAKRIADPIHKRVWATFGFKPDVNRVFCAGVYEQTVLCAYAQLEGDLVTDSNGVGPDGVNSVVDLSTVRNQRFVNFLWGNTPNNWRSATNTQLLGLNPVSLEQGIYRFNGHEFPVYKQTLCNDATNVTKVTYFEVYDHGTFNPGPGSPFQSEVLSYSMDYEDFVTWNASFVSTLDYDGDGYEWPYDCNDYDSAAYPNATLTADNIGWWGSDTNCNGLYDNNELSSE